MQNATVRTLKPENSSLIITIEGVKKNYLAQDSIEMKL
jgi:hypothetical protein